MKSIRLRNFLKLSVIIITLLSLWCIFFFFFIVLVDKKHQKVTVIPQENYTDSIDNQNITNNIVKNKTENDNIEIDSIDCCLAIPKPRIIQVPEEFKDDKRVSLLYKEINHIENINYKSSQMMCLRRKKLFKINYTHNDEHIKIYIDWNATPLPVSEKYLKNECEVNSCTFTNTIEDANILTYVGRGWALYPDYNKGNKTVCFFGTEVMVKNLNVEIINNIISNSDYILGFHSYVDLHVATGFPVFHDKFGVLEEFRKHFSYPTLNNSEEEIEDVLSKHNKKIFVSSFISNCCTDEGCQARYRTLYMLEMEKYINIHSYGRCKLFKNKVTEDNKISNCKYCRKVYYVNKYKFVIAFENIIRYNYVTEKIKQVMFTYSIPIYLGAPNIKNMILPEGIFDKYKIFVFANDYPNPKDLVDEIKYLSNNKTAYEEYFQWKKDGIKIKFKDYDYELSTSKGVAKIFCRLCKLYKYGYPKTCSDKKMFDNSQIKLKSNN